MNISIVGCGNLGCAYAYKLAEYGHEISMLKTSKLNDDNYNVIKQQGGIYGIDHTCGGLRSFQAISIITKDVSKALCNAEIVIVLTQTLYHCQVADLICSHLPKTLKMLLIIPGALGSIFFSKRISRENLLIAEGESSAFDARISKYGEIEILFTNVRNALGFIPNKRNEEGVSIAKQIYPTYVASRSNVIESSLHNPNLVVHTTGVIMSASRIEYSKGEFWLYKEAFTPSTWNLISALDEEKNQVIKAYEGVPMNYLEVAEWRNSIELGNPMESFNNYSVNGSPKGPSSLNTRYIWEDVPNGLVLLIQLATYAGIEVPVAKSLLCIANAIWKTDFMKLGRDLASLNIVDYCQLKALL